MNVHELQQVVGHLQTYGLDQITLRQLAVIAILSEAPGEMDFGDMRKRMGLSAKNKGAATRAIDTLSKAGIVTRARNPMDHRRVFCALTPRGREVALGFGVAA